MSHRWDKRITEAMRQDDTTKIKKRFKVMVSFGHWSCLKAFQQFVIVTKAYLSEAA